MNVRAITAYLRAIIDEFFDFFEDDFPMLYANGIISTEFALGTSVPASLVGFSVTQGTELSFPFIITPVYQFI